MKDATASKIVALLHASAHSSPTVRDLVEIVAVHLEEEAPLRTSDAVADVVADRVLDLLASEPTIPSNATLVALIADALDESDCEWERLFQGLLNEKLPMAPDRQ